MPKRYTSRVLDAEGPLEAFLGFSDRDLNANRQGVLSATQAWRLRWSGLWRLVAGPVLLLACLVVAFVATSAFLAVGALAVAVMGLYLTWHGFAFLTDASAGTIAFVSGPLHRRSEHGRYGTYYYGDIGPVTKRISSQAYDSLRTGPYHLYYAPGCRSLLSLEPASSSEPKPPHPFGPDSAHVWDRMRWSWALIGVGALGLLIGMHAITVAHPAIPVKVNGTISDYYEHHGKGGTTRHLYLRGSSNSYSPEREDAYDPPVPGFSSLIGKEVELYINDGTSDVIAISDYQHLYAGDWYLHPEHETVNAVMNGMATAIVSVLGLLGGVLLIVFGRRSAAAQPQPDPALARTPLYTMPSIRPATSGWQAALLLVVVGTTLSLALRFAVHG